MEAGMLGKWEMLCSLYEKYEQNPETHRSWTPLFLEVLMLYLIIL